MQEERGSRTEDQNHETALQAQFDRWCGQKMESTNIVELPSRDTVQLLIERLLEKET